MPTSTDSWPISSCTTEIRAHRALFYVVVVPMLGFWLPYLMFQIGGYVLIATGLSALGHAANTESSDTTGLSAVSACLPLVALAVGLTRERRRVRDEESRALATEIPLPPKQGKVLVDVVTSMWIALQNRDQRVPRVILQPNMDVTAHAYDAGEDQAIELSAGLATRVVRADPLALSVLRHEMAHLIHGDLPAIRREAVAAGGATFAIKAALAVCVTAMLGVLVAADLVEFPLEPTLYNVAALHLTVLVASVLVTLPLLLGPYLVQRYSRFLVALVETRADASAGLWGEGLRVFAAEVEQAPGLRFATARDVGLAYLSPSLSHLPPQDRVALLRDAELLATPKLRYFVAAVLVVWMFTFHQGDMGWDTALLTAVVALLQAVTVRMALVARGRARLSLSKATALATGLLALQALPLISVEGLAYLAQHLTAAIVVPGGFGSADSVDYLGDARQTLAEFGRHVVKATGGPWFLVGVGLAALSIAALYRLAPEEPIGGGRYLFSALPAAAFVLSVLVSHKFFQEPLYWPVRWAAFRWSPPGKWTAEGWWEIAVHAAEGGISRALFYVSELLHGSPVLESLPWLRLALPQLVAIAIALVVFRRSSMWVRQEAGSTR